jgi:2-pyrone-4,6-dicarboxylate lactonase
MTHETTPVADCLPPMELSRITTPASRLPADACDAHTHIFGPASAFPYAADRTYTPPDASFEDLRALHGKLGISRGVIVQPGCHGYDMSAVLDALAKGRGQYRAVALLPAAATAADVKRLDAAGVRGVRFNFVAHLKNVAWTEVQDMARLIADFGWHICIHSDRQSLPELLPLLKRLEVPFVLDHMGRVAAGDGTDSGVFRELLALRDHGRAWIKISGIDRISSSGKRPYNDGRPFVKALVESMADRLLWGSDWPHPNVRGDMPDDGELVNIFTEICPDREAQEKILVSNPQVLYRFGDA